MTIDRPLTEIGVRELRDRLRAVLARVLDGEPYVVLSNSAPVAVMLSKGEADRWERIERGLAALHGLEIYPELARDTSELAQLMRRERTPSGRELERLARAPRDILGLHHHVKAVSDVRMNMAEVLDEVSHGRPWLIVSSGRYTAVMIRPAEYDRLLRLRRTVAWFRAAGLDLATATDDEVIAWARSYTAQPSAAEAGEGSAIA